MVEQLIAAMNRHDAKALASFFAADYRSEQPLHPNRGFGGSEQVLANWTSVFEGVPDFFAERVASCSSEGTVWTKMRWKPQPGVAHLGYDGVSLCVVEVGVLGDVELPILDRLGVVLPAASRAVRSQ